MPGTITWRSIEVGSYNHEHQHVDLGLIVTWPKKLGQLWDCDFCGKRFEVGDVMAEHNVTEEDYGQPYGSQDRYWFSRIHVEHYEIQPAQ